MYLRLTKLSECSGMGPAVDGTTANGDYGIWYAGVPGTVTVTPRPPKNKNTAGNSKSIYSPKRRNHALNCVMSSKRKTDADSPEPSKPQKRSKGPKNTPKKQTTLNLATKGGNIGKSLKFTDSKTEWPEYFHSVSDKCTPPIIGSKARDST